MIGFHVDMNTAQFKREYLEKWLKQLADMGYDTILWEVENNIQWETCPECVSPDAFSKAEFKELLAYADGLGFNSIPLLQTIGHAEYVLKHDKYKYLAERDDDIRQYCPLKPQVVQFLHQWIEEYFDVFSNVSHFHIGADEAWILGSCEECRSYSEKHSLSELYINHVNAIAVPIIKRNVKPVIWGDMILHHPQALEILSRDIVIFDWMYDIYRGNGKFFVWGKGKHDSESVSEEDLGRFGKYLFPKGDEPGQIPETFYTADFLADQGFEVVTCPGSSSYGDTVFAPRNLYHMRNTFDSMHKGRGGQIGGSVLTSWTCHLFPWELQMACIAVPEYIEANPDNGIDDYKQWFVEKYYGLKNGAEFWKACGLLSKSCLFAYNPTLGCGKHANPIPLEHADKLLYKLGNEGKLEKELKTCQLRLEEYKQALRMFEELSNNSLTANDLLDYWILAAQNLINRALVSEWLISNKLGLDISEVDGIEILDEMNSIKVRTQKMYSSIIKPARRQEMIDWIYNSVEYSMKNVLKIG